MNTPLINVMSAAAIKAGKGLLRDFGEVDQLHISRKGAANFVTKSDIRTEKLLQKELSVARPDFGFLMEEGGEVPGKDTSMRWIIDPIDGTTNFIHAIPYFCISVGLEKREAGRSEIVAGVIYDPIHNEVFAAEKGKGAFVNSRRLAVSSREKFDETILVTGNHRLSATTERSKAFAQFDAITQAGGTVRFFGATALDMANLASGRIDACWYHSFQPWDVAAGLLLVKEAGGTITDLSGAPVDVYSKTLLATNRHLNLPVQKLLSQAA